MQELASYLASTAVAHAQRRGPLGRRSAAHEAMRAKVPQTMTVCAAYLEAQIVGPWSRGTVQRRGWLSVYRRQLAGGMAWI